MLRIDSIPREDTMPFVTTRVQQLYQSSWPNEMGRPNEHEIRAWRCEEGLDFLCKTDVALIYEAILEVAVICGVVVTIAQKLDEGFVVA